MSTSPYTLGSLPLAQGDLFRHLLIFGNTGAGKTRFVLLPLLQQIMARNCHDGGLRAGVWVEDVKGDFPGHLKGLMARAGRSDEILTIGRDGNC